MPAGVTVSYVDRLKVADLRREYPELAEWDLTEADVLDDGESLFVDRNRNHRISSSPTTFSSTAKIRSARSKIISESSVQVGSCSTQFPTSASRSTIPRRDTYCEHMIADYEHGPEASRSAHFDDWARLVEYKDNETPEQTLARARDLERAGHSIHMHVWTQAEFLQLILAARHRFDNTFDIEAAVRRQIEFVVVLRKNGPLPAPHADAATPQVASTSVPTVTTLRLKGRARPCDAFEPSAALDSASQ